MASTDVSTTAWHCQRIRLHAGPSSGTEWLRAFLEVGDTCSSFFDDLTGRLDDDRSGEGPKSVQEELRKEEGVLGALRNDMDDEHRRFEGELDRERKGDSTPPLPLRFSIRRPFFREISLSISSRIFRSCASNGACRKA